MPTDARRDAMVDKLRADFAEMDKRADARRLLKDDITPCGATAPGFSFLIAPGVLSADPEPASNVVSIVEARAKRKMLRERTL
jgi:hypothetical protein